MDNKIIEQLVDMSEAIEVTTTKNGITNVEIIFKENQTEEEVETIKKYIIDLYNKKI